MATVINTYTKSGKPVRYGSKTPPSPLGTLIDGRVYQRPRLSASGGIGAGGRVTVTNPKASPISSQRRTASLGMGGIDQYRNY